MNLVGISIFKKTLDLNVKNSEKWFIVMLTQKPKYVIIFKVFDYKGFIYVKFSEVEASKKAISVLDSRFFAGRQLAAGYVADSVYYAKFPKAADL